MSRAFSLLIPGLYLHVMARGNNRAAIFHEAKDFRCYLKLLRRATLACKVEVHAYCLMPNHIHLLVRSKDAFLPECIRRVHGAYGRWFNNKYGRVGHLFQGRYRAKIIADERYLLEVGRYIHMNPVAAKIVARPEEYPWSSLRTYLRGRRSALVRRDILGASLDRSTSEGFYAFTIARWPALSPEADFGDKEWYSAAEDELGEPSPIAFQEQSHSADYWIGRTAKALGFEVDRLLKGRGDPTLRGARAFTALVLRRATPMKLGEIAECMGYRSQKSVGNAIARARALIRRYAQARHLLQSLDMEP